MPLAAPTWSTASMRMFCPTCRRTPRMPVLLKAEVVGHTLKDNGLWIPRL